MNLFLVGILAVWYLVAFGCVFLLALSVLTPRQPHDEPKEPAEMPTATVVQFPKQPRKPQ